MNTLQKILLGLTQSEKERQALSPAYTQDPYGEDISKVSSEKDYKGLEKFIKAKNPYVYTQAYQDDPNISPSQAYDIVTKGKVDKWAPKETTPAPAPEKIEQQRYPKGWTEENIRKFKGEASRQLINPEPPSFSVSPQIIEYATKTYPGSLYDEKRLNEMGAYFFEKTGDADMANKLTARAVSKSIPETGMGKNAYKPDQTAYKTNIYSYWPDSDKFYDPETEAEMMETLYPVIQDGGAYSAPSEMSTMAYIFGPNLLDENGVFIRKKTLDDMTPEQMQTIRNWNDAYYGGMGGMGY